METHRARRRYPLLLLSLGLLVVVVLCRQLERKNEAPIIQAAASESAEPVAEPSVPASESEATPPPRFAPSLLESAHNAETVATAAENEAQTQRTDRDRLFFEERRIMAKTWGLTPDQEAEFEIAVRDGLRERQAVFVRLARGEITPVEVAPQLDSADERARQRLIEAIGADRLLEYQLMNGHFVEAGLDREPFVPPRPVALPGVAAPPASTESQAQTAPSAPLAPS